MFAVIVAGVAAATILFPITPFLWMNWASAGSLALLTCALLVITLRGALGRRRAPAHATPPTVGAPSLEAPGISYVLSWKMPLVRWLIVFSIGMCLALNLIPGAVVVAQ
jgi:hypothetical protein